MGFGVTFGTKHSFTDYGLEMLPYIDAKPTATVITQDIIGGGTLDLTPIIGYGDYKNFTKQYEFHKMLALAQYEAFKSTILNDLDGRKLKVRFDKDPDFYRVGTLTVLVQPDGKVGVNVSVSCYFDPFKYKNDITTETIVSETTETVTITNSRMKSTPTFTTTASGLTVQVNGGAEHEIIADGHTIPEIYFVEGDNTVKIDGDGTVVVTWQEGCL